MSWVAAARASTILLPCIEPDWSSARLQHEHDAYPQADFLRAARDAARTVTAQPFLEQGLTGTAIGEAIRRARIETIAAIDRAPFQAVG